MVWEALAQTSGIVGSGNSDLVRNVDYHSFCPSPSMTLTLSAFGLKVLFALGSSALALVLSSILSTYHIQKKYHDDDTIKGYYQAMNLSVKFDLAFALIVFLVFLR